MESIKVKPESFNQFFNDHGRKEDVRGLSEDDSVHRPGSRISRYHFMRDSIYVRKSFPPGTQIIFLLEDRAESGSILENTYTYEVKEHDSVCDELVLMDFAIKLLSNPVIK